MKTWLITFAALAVAVAASAHVTVAPQQSPAGATQTYKVRIHNGGKAPTASIELQIPSGVTIESVAPVPSAKSTMAKTGDRVSAITWEIAVPPGKYVEVAFTAKNPSAGDQLIWTIRERSADGTITEYSDKPNAKDKASMTKLTR
jgi:uncharacterized protein YcnI